MRKCNLLVALGLIVTPAFSAPLAGYNYGGDLLVLADIGAAPGPSGIVELRAIVYAPSVGDGPAGMSVSLRVNCSTDAAEYTTVEFIDQHLKPMNLDDAAIRPGSAWSSEHEPFLRYALQSACHRTLADKKYLHQGDLESVLAAANGSQSLPLLNDDDEESMARRILGSTPEGARLLQCGESPQAPVLETGEWIDARFSSSDPEGALRAPYDEYKFTGRAGEHYTLEVHAPGMGPRIVVNPGSSGPLSAEFHNLVKNGSIAGEYSEHERIDFVLKNDCDNLVQIQGDVDDQYKPIYGSYRIRLQRH